MIYFLQTPIIQVHLVQAIFVVWAVDLDELGGLGERWILCDNYELIAQLIWGVEFIFEDLMKHDALVKLFDFDSFVC